MKRLILITAAVTTVVVGGLTALLVNIFERKQEAKNPFFRVVELTDDTEDPAIWGKNFPLQYDGYRRTTDQVRTKFGGSEAMPRTPTQADPRSVVAQSRLEEDPRLKTMWAGYAFAMDFREERGHAYMLDDQTFTERQQVVEAAGHLHALPRLRLRALQEARASGDLIKGFEKMNAMPYTEARKLVEAPGGVHRLPRSRDHAAARDAPRIHRRASARSRPSQGVADYDVNTMATRQEMRSFVCGQCHVEYYFKGPEKRLVYPVGQGPEGRGDPRLLRRGRAQGLDACRDRRAGAQGPAPGVRDVEPGHPCPLRRGLRRLPHALQARGRLQDQRPPRAQPAAEHQPRLPDLPQVARGGAEGAGRDDPGPHVPAAQRRDGRADGPDRRPQGRAERRARPTSNSPRRGSSSARRSSCSTSSRRRTRWASTPRRKSARILGQSIDRSRQGQLSLGPALMGSR